MSALRTASSVAAVLSAALIWSTASAWAQQDFSKVEIRTVPVSGNISMLMGAGGNIGVITGPDGVFLIDDDYAPMTKKIHDAVKALSGEPIHAVINTHWHGDHTGGNKALGDAGVVIIAHDNVRTRMASKQFMKAFGREVPPSPPAALPVVTFADTLTLHINGDKLRAFKVDPAHTDGDIVLHMEKANVIHMGDTYFAGRYPFIDESNGGSFAGVLATAERVLGIADADTKIIPGHGPLSNKAELKQYRKMLVTIRDRVSAAIADGKTLDEIIAAKPLADLDAAWGSGFVKAEWMLGFAHASLTR